ncbi:hypothetical protein [Pseudomonas sp. ACN8]|uniref:hypothetical protein n=1 Tax=Pseudomonas sp. ACN8 TaxID=1920428 RepID=UPI00211538D0|nr:hypothetical protein [Pseudomonas sp. ACN8]
MVACSDTTFREQQMLEQAKKSILDSGDFLPPDQIAQRLGLPPMTLITTVDEWKARGQIFSIEHAGCSLFPMYTFQNGIEHGPVPDLKAILDLLRTKKDGWGIAFWFASSNAYIGGCRPQDILLLDAGKLLLAATDEVSGIIHG